MGISAAPKKLLPMSEYKNSDHMAAITTTTKPDEFIFSFNRDFYCLASNSINAFFFW